MSAWPSLPRAPNGCHYSMTSSGQGSKAYTPVLSSTSCTTSSRRPAFASRATSNPTCRWSECSKARVPMRLDELIETVLPTLIDEMEGYSHYELSLVALRGSTPLAQSLIHIRHCDDDYTVTFSEVQIFEPL